jgi:hypothetical protein
LLSNGLSTVHLGSGPEPRSLIEEWAIISNSFSEGEIQVLEFILQTLLRGGTPSMATRNKDFAAVYRKVMTMKKRVEEKKSQAKISSSVGTVAAADDDDLHRKAG